MQGVKIAIGGKGGVGKTTVCAVWAQLFAEDGLDVLAIDADPNANLALAFGIRAEQSPEPLINMKQLIAERTGASKEAVGAYFKLNPKVSDLPRKHWLEVGAGPALIRSGGLDSSEVDNYASPPTGSRPLVGANKCWVKLLVLGAITQGGAGCACPEGAFLKAMLSHTILQRQEVVLVDLAAGVEFMGRASVQGIDALVIVVEPGGRSIETANTVAKMARQLHIKSVGAIANKITDPAQTRVIRSQLKDIVLLGSLAYSASIQQADLERAPVIDADTELVEQLRQAKDALTDMIFSSTKSEIGGK
jgi:CO dehydrogenase maturation factor